MSIQLSMAENLEETKEKLIAARENLSFILQRPQLKNSQQFPLNHRWSSSSPVVSTRNSRCFHFRPCPCHGLLFRRSRQLCSRFHQSWCCPSLKILILSLVKLSASHGRPKSGHRVPGVVPGWQRNVVPYFQSSDGPGH
jgi:hypothetical protein